MTKQGHLKERLERHLDDVWRCSACGFAGWAVSFLWHAGCPVCGCAVRHGLAERSRGAPCVYCGLGDGAHTGNCRLQPTYSPAAMGSRQGAPRPDTPLSDARAWLLQARERGVRCPCCDQFARIYKRKLNYSMAYTLILIYEYFADHDDWLHVPSYLNGRGVVARGGDWAKMVYWGLIIGSGKIRDDTSPRVGHYKITERGVAFVQRELAVPAYVVVYNATVIGRSERLVYVDETLGEHFNYAALMSGTVRATPRPPLRLPSLPRSNGGYGRTLLDMIDE